jgi:hypothetical protein
MLCPNNQAEVRIRPKIIALEIAYPGFSARGVSGLPFNYLASARCRMSFCLF